MQRTVTLGLLVTASCLVRGESSPAPELDLREVAIVVNDEPYTGFLIPPPDETTFRFKLTETGDTLNIFWSSLAPGERKRVQKLFGIEVEEGLLVWGKDVEAVRLTLSTGKTVEGIELPERAAPYHRCLKTATRVMQVPRNLIESESFITLRESRLFSAREYYEREIAVRPPADENASHHVEFARLCATIGMYLKGIEHLKMAEVIDPRTAELQKPLLRSLEERYNEQLAERFYLELVTAKNAGDFATARAKLDLIGRNFSESAFRARAEEFRGEIEKGFQEAYKKQVVNMYYYLCGVLIREKMAKKMRIDEKGGPVPVEPGKQVVTDDGRRFTGLLLENGDEWVVLKQGDTTLRIRARNVDHMIDVDLSQAYGTIDPTYRELHDYVVDKDGGLHKDILERIADRLKLEVAAVRDTWESRFHAVATYEDGILTKTPIFARVQSVSFSKGTWLAVGAESILSRHTGHPRVQLIKELPKGLAEEFPDASHDPEQWWLAQTGEVKYVVLMGLAAQTLFRVKGYEFVPCSECGGRGSHEVLGSDVEKLDILCLTCRGFQAFLKVLYE